MSRVDNKRPESAIKTEAQLLSRLSSIGQKSVALDFGVSESHISKTRDDDLEVVVKWLDALGLTVWPQEMGVPDPEEFAAIKTLAKKYMQQ
jgi:hypothetical protein